MKNELSDPEPGRTVKGSTGLIIEALSEREIEVLHLVAAGKSNREIASELVVALGTAASGLAWTKKSPDAEAKPA